ncbi:acyl-CoA dehydrogenase family protein [Rhodococcus sp. NCIMB 12038]|uniref:acyl-CoA dehydrogenase family protein n=1 Tax=Rhodococcus sp. NCIMB 12038 TaxID=933800 RepID=UPI000B3D35C9|nr:acyl-CoA dehydrogenase family protein [Rhodococcus sp. NCIMB 12038]OUS92237.1 acyl-CoA dehydrogenase [Rhodococcus sp. NCIMB 12038]
MDTDEKDLFRTSLEKVAASAGPDAWPAAVADFGWHELLEEDAETAVSILSDLQGRFLPHTSFVDDVALAATSRTDWNRHPEAPVTRTVFPGLGTARVGSILTGGPATDSGDCTVAVAGVVSMDPRATSSLLVPALDGSALAIVTVPFHDEDLTLEPAGIEPESGWTRVAGTVAGKIVATGAEAADLWQAMRGAAYRALAYELNSIGREMLAATVEHVSSRKQFGRELGSFQAVKHALADTRVWQECAELAADAAWESATPQAAILAKTLSGRFFRSAAENCQQLLGGMGFTWEHSFHRYLRRGLILEQLLGTSAELRAELGATVKSGDMPVLAPL